MTFLTRSLRYTLVATTALTLNTLIPAWADQTNACRDIIVHSVAQRHQQALEQSFHLFKNNGNGLPLLHTPSETYTYSKEAYRIDWQLEDARAEKKLDEWEGGIGGAFYYLYVSTENPDPDAIPFNAILSMHIANTEQGMSRQDSAQKLFTYFLNMYRVTDDRHNLIPNGLVEVWNDLDEASRKRHIRSIMFADNRKDKLLLDLLIQSGGHGITVTDTDLSKHSRENAHDKSFMDLVTTYSLNPPPPQLWSDTLTNLVDRYPHIHSLHPRGGIYSHMGSINAGNLATELANYPRITSLYLSNNRIASAGVQALANSPYLKVLDLSCNPIGDLGLTALAQNGSLKELNLQNNGIGDAGAFSLAGNRNLRVLYLARNLITSQGVTHLAGNTSLGKLDLSGNQINDIGAAALAQNESLKELNLQINLITSQGATHLAGNRLLQKLDLAFNQIDDAGADALARNTTLQDLNLWNNRINDAGAAALARNTTLLALNLGRNLIGDAGLIALAGNKTLQELHLRHNYICDAGAQEFLRLLIQNKSPLKKLDISENYGITQATKEAFKVWATAHGVELLI